MPGFPFPFVSGEWTTCYFSCIVFFTLLSLPLSSSLSFLSLSLFLPLPLSLPLPPFTPLTILYNVPPCSPLTPSLLSLPLPLPPFITQSSASGHHSQPPGRGSTTTGCSSSTPTDWDSRSRLPQQPQAGICRITPPLCKKTLVLRWDSNPIVWKTSLLSHCIT